MAPNTISATIGWAFLVIGGVLLTIGVVMLGMTWYRRSRWRRRTATVVDDVFTYSTGADINSSGYSRLVLEWVGDDGVRRRHTESVGRTRIRVPRGKQLPILVDPQRPDHIQRAGSGYGVAFALAGALFIAIRLFAWP